MSDCKFKEADAPRLVPAILTDPKHMLLVFAAYLYLSGFIYAHYYYGFFALPFSAGDVPAYNMFIYALNVFLRFSWVSGMTLGVLVGVAIYNTIKAPPRWVEIVLLIVMVGFAPVIFFDSARIARGDAADSREGIRPLANVTVVLTAAAKLEYTDLPGWTKAVETNQLRLVAQNEAYYYLIFQEFPEEGNLPAMRIYWVKREDTVALEVLVNRKKNNP